ncbi:hypothetical protein AB7Y10_22725, partial [Escherichia coli]
VGKAERLTWHKAWTMVSTGFSISYTSSVAITAYNHAIGTALAEASANKASTASAVAALVPDSVLDELNKATL